MRVIIVRVGKKPLIEDIPEEKKSFKKIVGGVFETKKPFRDQSIAVVCNAVSETVNRWIVDEGGASKFIAMGDFFICKVDAAGSLCGFTAGEAVKWKRELER